MAGQLTAVAVPSEFVEAARHLSRGREQVRGDVMRARHRVSKLLLAHGRVYDGATPWNKTHRAWLGAQRFEQAPTELAFIDLLAAVDGLIARKDALDERLSRMATDERLWPTVSRLRCFRGVDTLTALAVHLELGGDWQRFSSPRKLFSWLGLTPTLDQSGQSKTQGSITKTGSTYARRLLVEAAWHYARPPRVGATVAHPPAGQPHPGLPIARPAPPPPPSPAAPPTSSRPPGAPSPACTVSTTACASAASRTTLPPSQWRESLPDSCGPRPPRPELTPTPKFGRGGVGPPAAGTRGSTMGSPRRPRPLLDSACRATKPAPWVSQRPHHQD